ncbi:MAG: sigma-70 family RNA polymerase sigma factor [Anaerohalosphaera sp.]|nr:sigma-70 family RNA polymerase sigma factor [Anaerohalosphaera sp.]
MAITPNSVGLTFDLLRAEAVPLSQQWILHGMRDYGPALVTMLWRILGNKEDVCDAYQDTFLNLAHLPDKRKPKNVRAYLFSTASNVAISMLRYKQLQRRHQDALLKKYESTQNDFCMDLDAAGLQQQLRDAIAELPEYLGNVIVLRDLAQMPYSQVAKILGIRTTAARVYRHKAIKLLSMWMSKQENRDEL